MTNINTDQVPGGKGPRKPRILVAPLDWGLGHATRCIPVIYEFIRQGADIWLAGTSAQEELLRREFPGLPFLRLTGYRVKLSRSAAGLWKSLLFQLPRLLRTVRKEHRWLQQQVDKHQFDAVIADNRYGLHHPVIRCVIIIHQLRIRSPLGKWSEGLLQRINYRFIGRFAECWIPDAPLTGNLAGELSHPVKKPAIPIRYLGILSRLVMKGIPVIVNRLFISLSGPEPQRSLLENKLIEDISHYAGTAVVVRGLPAEANIIPSSNDIRFYNHLETEEYSKEMEQAEVVISRSGYSTIMDIATLQKKAILIPTPGQTEQEYLATYLASGQQAVARTQHAFNLEEALREARMLNPHFAETDSEALAVVVRTFLLSLKTTTQVS